MQYTYLEKLLSHGLYVTVKDKDGYFIIFTPNKDKDGGYRTSSWENSIEECKYYLGAIYYSKQELITDSPKWTLVEAYYPTFKPFEIGQRVRTIGINGEYYIDEIKQVFDNKYFLKGLGNNEYIHHTELIPLPDETPITLSTVPSEELLQEVKRRGLTTTGEIIKG